ncbi:hypothetical protein ABT010_40440 [Streptomyces sp. NPDC002668]|uniref:hypothetical protein n=1 Tax=Streptomyces sp. NPDC002668 TaxID=3154422 RepID=UPI003320F3B9
MASDVRPDYRQQSQWAADWLSRRRVKEGSLEKYEIAIRVHLNPRWGRQRLRSIKKAQVEAWVQEMEANESLVNSTGSATGRSSRCS